MEDIYNNVDSQNDSSCASDKSWDIKKDGGQDDDTNIVCNDDMEQDDINDLNENLLHLHNGLGDNIKYANNKLQYIEEGKILNEDKGQGKRNHFGNANNIPLAKSIPLAQNEYFGGANNNDNGDDDNDNDNDNDDDDDDDNNNNNTNNTNNNNNNNNDNDNQNQNQNHGREQL